MHGCIIDYLKSNTQKLSEVKGFTNMALSFTFGIFLVKYNKTQINFFEEIVTYSPKSRSFRNLNVKKGRLDLEIF